MNFQRQYDIFNPDEIKQPTVYIVGCGGIGSFLGYYLAQMGLRNFVLHDGDSVEDHNLPNQNFLQSHLGLYKTDALRDMIEQKVGEDRCSIKCKRSMFGTESKFSTVSNDSDDIIVIAVTDSIKSRELLFNKAKSDDRVKYFVDGRLGGLMFQMLTVNMEDEYDVSEYQTNCLFSSDEAEQLPCTERNVIFIGSMISSMMAHHVYLLLTQPDVAGEKNRQLVDLYTGVYQSDTDGKMTMGFLR